MIAMSTGLPWWVPQSQDTSKWCACYWTFRLTSTQVTRKVALLCHLQQLHAKTKRQPEKPHFRFFLIWGEAWLKERPVPTPLTSSHFSRNSKKKGLPVECLTPSGQRQRSRDFSQEKEQQQRSRYFTQEEEQRQHYPFYEDLDVLGSSPQEEGPSDDSAFCSMQMQCGTFWRHAAVRAPHQMFNSIRGPLGWSKAGWSKRGAGWSRVRATGCKGKISFRQAHFQCMPGRRDQRRELCPLSWVTIAITTQDQRQQRHGHIIGKGHRRKSIHRVLQIAALAEAWYGIAAKPNY